MALNSEVDQKANNHVLRVDQDSDSDLQALFDSVLKPDSKRPLQVPLRMRQLPKSFFNPPSTGSKSPSISHSRENSADSAFGSAGGGAAVSHSRAHSSPASLQQTYAAGGGGGQGAPPTPHRHAKQRSYDVAPTLHEELGPLPPGWEQARTPEGQIYYLNHMMCTTTWEDPRKARQAELLAAQPTPPPQPAPTPTAATKGSPGGGGGGGGGVAGAGTGATGAVANDSLGTLPDGWEQAATPEGEIYFLNHTGRTTSWFDPRIPQHLQRTPAAGIALPRGWGASTIGTAEAIQACQKLRIQSLQLERDRLKQRQQEIRLQQELMARHTSSVVSGNVVSGADLPLDPFLSGLTEHSRQESGDSGLGMGLAQSYSMPHTPEDFLANIDDNMDCASEGGGNTMDANDISLSDNIDSTDDLVPSLQLGEEFSSDILDDVQSLINPATSKQGNGLTWL